jgi:hypothetical protein
MTAEYCRHAIRVLQLCEKLRVLTVSASVRPSAAANNVVATVSSSASTAPPLRDLVKSATLLYEVHALLSGDGNPNLIGIDPIDAQMPFLSSVSELLHDSGRRILYETMRGSSATSSAGGASAHASSTQVNQIDLNYVLQVFYNMAPNVNVPLALLRSRSAKQAVRRNGGAMQEALLASPDDSASASDSTGGVELVVVLDELLHTYLDQLRSALKKILDIATTPPPTAASIEAAKRAAAGGKLPASASAAAPAATPASLRSTLWDRLDSFTELCFTLTVQVWTLTRILHEKRDIVYNAAPGLGFSDVYRIQRRILDQRKRAAQQKQSASSSSKFIEEDEGEEVTLLHTFWHSLCELLRTEFSPLSSPSSSPGVGHSSHNFLRTIFVNEYPRFHTLFERGVFERVSKYCASANVASASLSLAPAAGTVVNGAAAVVHDAPSSSSIPPPLLSSDTDRHALLSTLLPFFQLFLSRTLTALTTPVTLMFTAHEGHGSLATVPSRSDVSSYLSVVHASIETIVESRDEEVHMHVCRAIAKSATLLMSHAEGMLHTAVDRDVFSSSHISAASEKDVIPTRYTQASSTSACSQVQRNNIDLFALLCQVAREFTPHELARKYPGLHRSSSSAAILVLGRCRSDLEAMQVTVLEVLLNTVSKALIGSLYGIIPTGDDILPTATAAADGSVAMQSYRRKFNYCLSTLFPLYLHQLTGGSSSSSSLSAVDNASRQEMWRTKFLAPLNATLIESFVHLLSLHPLSTIAEPCILSERARAHVLNELTLFESTLQSLLPQPKTSRTRVAGVGAAAVEQAPIDMIHGYKELLFIAQDGEYLHLLTSHRIDAVTLLHFLFTTCCIHNHAASTSSSSSSSTPGVGVSHTAPHRLLTMRVDEYSKYIEAHNRIEIYELLQRAYSALESKIPSIPHGDAGREYVANSYSKLALLLKIMTRGIGRQ